MFGKKETVREESILSLLNKEKAVVVNEQVSLMGRTDHLEGDTQVLVLNPGDEIRVSSDKIYHHDDYDYKIQVWNEENPNLAQHYYFRKSELEGRKIKINPSVNPRYS